MTMLSLATLECVPRDRQLYEANEVQSLLQECLLRSQISATHSERTLFLYKDQLLCELQCS